jgi:hypothetical protein
MRPICKYECKNQQLLWDPYAGIAMNVKTSDYYGPICGYCNECKKSTTIIGPICEYCIFENALMEFIIENDVGIICLKCVYCFKSL